MPTMAGKGRFFVGGNWKCNETVSQVKQLVDELNAGTVPDDIEIVVAPTYIHLAMVSPPTGLMPYARVEQYICRQPG